MGILRKKLTVVNVNLTIEESINNLLKHKIYFTLFSIHRNKSLSFKNT